MKGCRPLSDLEFENVLSSFNGRYALRDKALFVLGVKSGFRISELLSLKVEDVQSNRVSVQRKNMKKKREGRTILLHPMAAQHLKAWITWAKLGADALVFQSQKGGSISRQHAWAVLNRQFDELALTGKLGTHSMRKTFAQNVHNKLGRDILKTQKALGHANINSTVSYLSFDEDEIDQAILDL